jgi:hypothetical protein
MDNRQFVVDAERSSFTPMTGTDAGEGPKRSRYGKLINRARRIRDLYRPDGNGGVMFG